MNYVYLLFPVMTLFGSLGAFFFKKGTEKLKGLVSLFLIWEIYVGGFFYVTAALLNIVALKYLPYSIVIPLTSITYIWTLIIARIALGEKITVKKVIGIILILIGSIYVAI